MKYDNIHKKLVS